MRRPRRGKTKTRPRPQRAFSQAPPRRSAVRRPRRRRRTARSQCPHAEADNETGNLNRPCRAMIGKRLKSRRNPFRLAPFALQPVNGDRADRISLWLVEALRQQHALPDARGAPSPQSGDQKRKRTCGTCPLFAHPNTHALKNQMQGKTQMIPGRAPRLYAARARFSASAPPRCTRCVRTVFPPDASAQRLHTTSKSRLQFPIRPVHK